MDKNPVNFGRIAIAICLASDIVELSPLDTVVYYSSDLFLIAKCLEGEIYEWKNEGKGPIRKKKQIGWGVFAQSDASRKFIVHLRFVVEIQRCFLFS